MLTYFETVVKTTYLAHNIDPSILPYSHTGSYRSGLYSYYHQDKGSQHTRPNLVKSNNRVCKYMYMVILKSKKKQSLKTPFILINDIPSSQDFPVQPLMQSHLYDPSKFTQEPPL